MTTPAGWYEDPAAQAGQGTQLRWWDGTAWTSHTRPRDGAAPSQPQGEPGHQGQQPYGAQQGQPYGGAQPQPYGGQPSAGAAHQGYGYPPASGAYAQQSGQYGGKATHTADAVPLASLGARLGAKILDWLLLGVLYVLLTLPVWPEMLEAYGRYMEETQNSAVTGAPVDPFGLYGDPAYQRFLLWSLVVTVLVSMAYTVLMLRLKAATVGKLALGIRVRRWERAGPLSWGQCFARWAAEYLPSTFCCGLWSLIDPLWCTWDKRKQAVHDKAAGTVVVRGR